MNWTLILFVAISGFNPRGGVNAATVTGFSSPETCAAAMQKAMNAAGGYVVRAVCVEVR